MKLAMQRLCKALLASLCLVGLTFASNGATKISVKAGAQGSGGLAVKTAKALIVPPDEAKAQYLDNALILVKDGKIQSVTPAHSTEVPEGYEFLDVEILVLDVHEVTRKEIENSRGYCA